MTPSRPDSPAIAPPIGTPRPGIFTIPPTASLGIWGILNPNFLPPKPGTQSGTSKRILLTPLIRELIPLTNALNGASNMSFKPPNTFIKPFLKSPLNIWIIPVTIFFIPPKSPSKELFITLTANINGAAIISPIGPNK